MPRRVCSRTGQFLTQDANAESRRCSWARCVRRRRCAQMSVRETTSPAREARYSSSRYSRGEFDRFAVARRGPGGGIDFKSPARSRGAFLT